MNTEIMSELSRFSSSESIVLNPSKPTGDLNTSGTDNTTCFVPTAPSTKESVVGDYDIFQDSDLPPLITCSSHPSSLAGSRKNSDDEIDLELVGMFHNHDSTATTGSAQHASTDPFAPSSHASFLSDADRKVIHAKSLEEHLRSSPFFHETDEQKAARVLKQVDFYFGDRNFPSDKFLRKHAKADVNGWIPLSVIGAYKKMKKITDNYALMADALRASEVVEVHPTELSVRRRHRPPKYHPAAICAATIVVTPTHPLDEATAEEYLTSHLSHFGPIVQIRAVKTQADIPDEVVHFFVKMMHQEVPHQLSSPDQATRYLVEFDYADEAIDASRGKNGRSSVFARKEDDLNITLLFKQKKAKTAASTATSLAPSPMLAASRPGSSIALGPSAFTASHHATRISTPTTRLTSQSAMSWRDVASSPSPLQQAHGHTSSATRGPSQLSSAKYSPPAARRGEFTAATTSHSSIASTTTAAVIGASHHTHQHDHELRLRTGSLGTAQGRSVSKPLVLKRSAHGNASASNSRSASPFSFIRNTHAARPSALGMANNSSNTSARFQNTSTANTRGAMNSKPGLQTRADTTSNWRKPANTHK